MAGDFEKLEAFLERMARDMQAVRGMVTEVVNYMKEAESEIPEKMRRFIMYMHDVHDIMHMYQETGQEPPEYVKAEARRCDDRYRHLLDDLNKDLGAFERVRQEMTKRAGNRWDHSRILPKQEKPNETRIGDEVVPPEGQLPLELGESGSAERAGSPSGEAA